MDKTAIRNFAAMAREQLIDKIAQKAFELGITADAIKQPELFQDGFLINGKFFKKQAIRQREDLIRQVGNKGLNQVIEEVAYTWFNRLVAIRFMEVNGYLPHGVRVLSSSDPGKAEPDAIREAPRLDLDLDMAIVYRYQDDRDAEGLFKYILVKQCNQLGRIMPVVFEEIADYTELLLPDNLLGEGSVIRGLVTWIPEQDWQGRVEIIGWLYQYYIAEKHEEVVGINKGIIKKEDIPAATQLFTPEWIVKYMVENSLGRLWLDAHPEDNSKDGWQYYLEAAEQSSALPEELKRLAGKDLKPEDITVFDPCMGSGHILVYAFDVLYQLYHNAGYPEREIPRLILENNLYGLDIDDRAAQLAYFAVLMKARMYNRRVLRQDLDLHLAAIQESNLLPKQEVLELFARFTAGRLWSDKLRADLEYLIDIFQDAKEYGSLITVKPVDFDAIDRALDSIRTSDSVWNVFEAPYREMILAKLPALVRQGRILSRKYRVVCTNPPYLGFKAMNPNLKKYINTHFPEFSADIFAVFIIRNMHFAENHGYLAYMSPLVWMFIKSYEKLRKLIVSQKSVQSLIQLEYGAFEEAVVPICAFVLRNFHSRLPGVYIKLTDFKGAALQPLKVLEAKNNPTVDYRYQTDIESFNCIPGCPLAYWVSDNIRRVFKTGIPLGDVAEPRLGMATGSNDIFVRLWHEVEFTKCNFSASSREEATASKAKWFPYNKGGEFRKWYGNAYYLVNWENDGQAIRNFADDNGRIRSHNYNLDYIFKESITWSFVSSTKFGVRYSPPGFLFDVGGSSAFTASGYIKFLLAFLCSKPAFELLKINSSLNYQPGNLASLPIILPEDSALLDRINELAEQNIAIAKAEWDCFETSWNFVRHPLLVHRQGEDKIAKAFANWQKFADKQYDCLRANEEKLNVIFSQLYGLEQEINPAVDEKDLTIFQAQRTREIKSFLSYAVGCIFGRYSLDEQGLVYAGGEFSDQWLVASLATNHFSPVYDNVIPITDDEYFEEDIVTRIVDFIKITFGESALEENLEYIAGALAPKAYETSRQTIRRYFLNDFFRDHVQLYQKRPIYWLFSSGKYNGFKALIYLHRYHPGTVAAVRTDCLHRLQRKYEAEITRLDIVLDSGASVREKNEARKRKAKLQRQLSECCQYDQVIAHIAHQKIAIDLDDGVKMNYAKFQGVEIPQGEGKQPLKADLLAPI